MPSPTPFEIDDTSALSLHKKQSSTYSKYACGCFLCAPSICIVYFKRLTEGHLLRCYAKINAQRSRTVTDVRGSSRIEFAMRTRRQNAHGWAGAVKQRKN